MGIRSVAQESHDQRCDCAAHRVRPPGLWSAMLPFLACAVCPVCLSNYAKLLSLAGMGFGMSETHHLILLAVAISASVIVSGWRSCRTKRLWPFAVAVTGSGLVLTGHMLGEVSRLEWTGVVVLFIGGITERLRLRKRVLARV